MLKCLFFFVTTPFLRASCSSGRNDTRIPAPSVLAKLQRVLTPLPAGRVKTKARSSQQDPASPLSQQRPRREVHPPETAVQARVAPSPSPGAPPGTWGRWLPLRCGPEGGHPLLAWCGSRQGQQLWWGRPAEPRCLLSPHTTHRGAVTKQHCQVGAWYLWAPLLPPPGPLASHLFFLFCFFFPVCFNFIVFPTLWEGAAAKNNVAKPRGLAHAAWSLQQQQRL